MHQQMMSEREATQIRNTEQSPVWQNSSLVNLCRKCNIEKSKLKIAGCLIKTGFKYDNCSSYIIWNN